MPLEWRPVRGFEEQYEISSEGDLRSLPRRGAWGGRIRAKGQHASGYITYQLWHGGTHTNKYAHRLVAEAWLGNPKEGLEVNHKDGNKKNNRVDNLEWVSPSCNIQHAFSLGLCTRKVGAQNKHSKHPELFEPIFKLYNEGISCRRIAEKFNIPTRYVYLLMLRIRKGRLDASNLRLGR